jgi:glucose-1-phosphate cytidylyltransferase
MKVVFWWRLWNRISEESHLNPKPMIEIGEKTIIWHIMKYFSYYGFNDFVICLGYKGTIAIKVFFADYYLMLRILLLI